MIWNDLVNFVIWFLAWIFNVILQDYIFEFVDAFQDILFPFMIKLTLDFNYAIFSMFTIGSLRKLCTICLCFWIIRFPIKRLINHIKHFINAYITLSFDFKTFFFQKVNYHKIIFLNVITRTINFLFQIIKSIYDQ